VNWGVTADIEVNCECDGAYCKLRHGTIIRRKFFDTHSQEQRMSVKQGSLDLLEHPASQNLLRSTIPARLAYVWTDGTPRVVPIWFHWTGAEFVLGTLPKAPKIKALTQNPKVALTIDDDQFPHKVLLVRGTAQLQTVKDIVPEYAMAAERYFG